jgi:hypothetical protein
MAPREPQLEALIYLLVFPVYPLNLLMPQVALFWADFMPTNALLHHVLTGPNCPSSSNMFLLRDHHIEIHMPTLFHNKHICKRLPILRPKEVLQILSLCQSVACA